MERGPVREDNVSATSILGYLPRERSPYRSGRSLSPEKLESLGRGVDLIVVPSTGKSGKFALEFTKPGGIAWEEHLPHEHADLPVPRIATIVCEGDRRNHRQWVQQ